MSFHADVTRIAEKMGEDAETVARATFIELFSAVISDTPVDQGRLRGDWQTTENAPASTRANRTQTGNSGAATAEVLLTVKDPGVYYLTNNMPYAERIEYDGYSKTKAPAGMVRKNVKRIKEILRKQSR